MACSISVVQTARPRSARCPARVRAQPPRGDFVTATRRSYLKTLETLTALQAAEEKKVEAGRQALREAAERARRAEPALENEPLAPAIGFVPSLPPAPAPAVPESLALRL